MILERHTPVLFFACFVVLLIFLAAYFTERDGFVDEPGFLNPPYMLAHYGKLTFPTYTHVKFFDVPVITHPPMHVGWIGLLWRMGMPPYYAEATPTVLLFCLAILIIVYSALPTAAKLGWLFSIGFLATSGETLTLCFGTRPEGELLAAWFCGLLLLESGRMENWHRLRLLAGSFFLTWASGTHYYAGPAFLGVLVYIVWAVRSLGWKEAKPRVIAMCTGGCLYGLPYLALYVLPYLHNIRVAIDENQGPGGIGLSIHNHMAMYRHWVQELYRPALIRKAMALGIPLWVLSTALLAAVRSTRGTALAALPLQLGLFLFAWHKMAYYMVHESVLFAAALAVAVLALCQWLIARYRPRLVWLYAPAAVVALCFCLVSGSPMLARAEVSLKPRYNEAEVAQAAGRRIMGPHARMGGRWWSWYSAGAEHWYDVERDLFLGYTLFDPATYLSNLDAIESCVEYKEHSDVIKWFADGTLKLRGFFFGQSNVAFRCVQLSVREVTPLVGYAEWDNQLYRFQEDPAGDYEVLSAVCPAASGDWHQPWAGTFSSAFGVPDDGSGAPGWLVTVLAARAYMAPAGQVGRSCREVSRTRGVLLFDDRRALVDWSRRYDAPVHFYRGLDEMPGYTGVGLPPDALAPPGAVRVQNVVDLSGIQSMPGASLARSPALRVTTLGQPGAFSALIPVNRADTIVTPCWVALKLRVRQGRVGFGAYTKEGLIAQTVGVAPSPEPQVVALKVPDFRRVIDIIVFNQTTFQGIADLLDASVMVMPEDAGFPRPKVEVPAPRHPLTAAPLMR